MQTTQSNTLPVQLPLAGITPNTDVIIPSLVDLDPMHSQILLPEDLKAIEGFRTVPKVGTFEELGAIGLRALKRHGKKVHMISAPITSGHQPPGYEHISRITIFHALIEHVNELVGGKVFSPMPFELAMERVATEWKRNRRNKGRYCYELIEDVYGQWFRSGLVSHFHLAPTYVSSKGCRREHRIYLDEIFVVEAIEAFLARQQAKKAAAAAAMASPISCVCVDTVTQPLAL